jgi:hypothetical protein
VEVDNGVGSSFYAYDALGRRIAKLANGNTVIYSYDGSHPIEEQNDSRVTEADYVYGSGVNDVLTMARNCDIYYCYQNALGSVVAPTADTNTSTAERYTYDSYGGTEVTDGTGTIVSTNS